MSQVGEDPKIGERRAPYPMR